MLQKTTLIFSIFISILFAEDKISIDDLIKTNYIEENINIEKKSLIFTKDEAKSIQEAARSKVHSKIVRYYKISNNQEVLGHAILLKQRIRTKNAAILYIVDVNNTMLGLEIVSFKEPSEYKPNDEWKKIFIGKTSEDTLIAGKDIATISGATLSARAISDAARLALAIATNRL
ncbi:MAG: Unknown protein [uncultured Sulfurovum sp.]|uniref:FMN-binding domain-containing protein n=1 Tax=uncultured Sulfurovum sp. TaxID=269237 RepID=A0A6S6TD83_9BACT|nr:MAG: Unknown protein [uncultured Sulfurovum sp.]